MCNSSNAKGFINVGLSLRLNKPVIGDIVHFGATVWAHVHVQEKVAVIGVCVFPYMSYIHYKKVNPCAFSAE